jgi:bifunctional DNA-binding transcriptional regulator/antitoxin component of YhaV-PrlF toxin-antitoxin module
MPVKQQVPNVSFSNEITTTFIISTGIARRHGLDEPSRVVVEEVDDGILVRKLKPREEGGHGPDESPEPEQADNVPHRANNEVLSDHVIRKRL